MTIRATPAARNAILDTGFDAIFNSGVLELRTGTQPASANDAASGTLLWSETLPADAFAASAAGSKAKAGTWEAAAVAAGSAGWYRLKQTADAASTDGTDERVDGSVTATGGGGDLTLDNVVLAVGQSVTITTFSVSI